MEHAELPTPSMISQNRPALKCESISLDEWQEFVDGHPESTPLHNREWIELLVAEYGFKLFLPAIRSGGQILAATAFLETRTLLGVRKLISLPFADCFTPLSYDDQALSQLLEVFATRHRADANAISIRMDRTMTGYAHDRRWVRHRIKLTTEMTDLLPTLAASAKRNIKHAVKKGLEFERRTDRQAVEDFFRLHVLTRRKLGVPVQAKSYFRRMHELVIESGLGFVGVVHSGRACIAAAIFIQNNGTMLYKYGASDPAALHQRPNDFLFFNAIQSAACDCQYFDFGITHLQDEGLRRFKRKWGADEEEIYDICIAGQSRGFSGESRAMKLASTMIRRSPTMLCRFLGHVFYKYSV